MFGVFSQKKTPLTPDQLQVDVGTLAYDYKVAYGVCVCNNPVFHSPFETRALDCW